MWMRSFRGGLYIFQRLSVDIWKGLGVFSALGSQKKHIDDG